MINGRDKHLKTFIEGVMTERSSKTNRHIDDPTTIGFSIFFDFEGSESPLFNETLNGESAIRYLKSINENAKADRLKRFKSNLQETIQKYPYFFKTLNGLEAVRAPWKGRGFKEDVVLKIQTLESIDLRIGMLIEDYIFSSTDVRYVREMLPDNLRRFKLYVILSEIRSFRTFAGSVLTSSSEQADEFNMIDLNKHLNAYIYKFYDCEFDTSAATPWFSDISMEKPDHVGNQLAIKCGRYEISHKFEFLDIFGAKDNDPSRQDLNSKSVGKQKSGFVNKLSSFYDQFKESRYGSSAKVFEREATEFLGNSDPRTIASQKAEVASGIVQAQLSKVLLGNVFSSRNAILSGNLVDSIGTFTDALSNSKNVGAAINSLILGLGPDRRNSEFRDSLGKTSDLTDGTSPTATLTKQQLTDSTTTDFINTKLELNESVVSPSNLDKNDLGIEQKQPLQKDSVNLDLQTANTLQNQTADLGIEQKGELNKNTINLDNGSVQSLDNNPVDLGITTKDGLDKNSVNLDNKNTTDFDQSILNLADKTDSELRNKKTNLNITKENGLEKGKLSEIKDVPLIEDLVNLGSSKLTDITKTKPLAESVKLTDVVKDEATGKIELTTNIGKNQVKTDTLTLLSKEEQKELNGKLLLVEKTGITEFLSTVKLTDPEKITEIFKVLKITTVEEFVDFLGKKNLTTKGDLVTFLKSADLGIPKEKINELEEKIKGLEGDRLDNDIKELGVIKLIQEESVDKEMINVLGQNILNFDQAPVSTTLETIIRSNAIDGEQLPITKINL